LWVGRELGDKEWIARGVECKEEIEKLAASASKWNFENSELWCLTSLQIEREEDEECITIAFF
jgi:hypothetical protein